MFERVERDGIAIHTVPSIFETCGVGIAFSERIGGVSDAPWSTLDLAGHVGDDAARVDRNRDLLCEAIGIGALRDRLTTAEQVHGTAVTRNEGAVSSPPRADAAVAFEPPTVNDAPRYRSPFEPLSGGMGRTSCLPAARPPRQRAHVADNLTLESRQGGRL